MDERQAKASTVVAEILGGLTFAEALPAVEVAVWAAMTALAELVGPGPAAEVAYRYADLLAVQAPSKHKVPS